MQKLDNLNKWSELTEKDVLSLPKETARTVKIYVNAPQETRLYYVTPGNKPAFLALVKGRDVVVFNHKGPLEVSADAPINVYTSENEVIHVEGINPKLTKIMERAPRDPRFEAMAQQMMANVNRRMDQQRKEYEALLKRKDAENAAAKKAEPSENAGDAGTKPKAGKAAEKTADEGKANKPEPSGEETKEAAE